MKKIIAIITILLVISGLTTVLAENTSSVAVIMYHNFVSEEDQMSGVVFDEYSITPQDFEEDLIYLKNNGYITITSEELIAHLEGNRTLPKKAIIISIDDGSWGVYKHAYPILERYNMKADLNVIGERIDETWESLEDGCTRAGEEAPYCTWEELVEMSESGVINICSHTYGMHVYNPENRIGMGMKPEESDEDYISAVIKDYELSVKCIEGWTGKAPTVLAYPYSVRDEATDKFITENTGYKILMAGNSPFGTAANYFTYDEIEKSKPKVLSRVCRMDSTPVGEYIEYMYKKDLTAGVEFAFNTLKLTPTECAGIASDYPLFDDVGNGDWFSGYVYYAYANSLMMGTSYTEFSPNQHINRAMAAALLYRMAGNPEFTNDAVYTDIAQADWYYKSANWANEFNILNGFADNTFRGDDQITREDLVCAIYQCAGSMLGWDTANHADLSTFNDSQSIKLENVDAMSWAVYAGIIKGNGDGTLNPKGYVTRAEMATMLQNFLSK